MSELAIHIGTMIGVTYHYHALGCTPSVLKNLQDLLAYLERQRDAENAAVQTEAGLMECVTELLAVANLRGDSDLPHPADDPKLWTARMQDAWDNLYAEAEAIEPGAVAKEVASSIEWQRSKHP